MKTCLSLADRSLSMLEEKMARHSESSDLIEVRLDYLKNPVVPRLPAASGTQFVATCRPEREGGRYAGSERDRLALLRRCAEAGYDWVDVEMDSVIETLPGNCRVIRSHHQFGQPPDLDEAFARLCQQGGDVFKLAVMVSSTSDLVRLLGWMEAQNQEVRRTIIGMGEMGQPSRYLGELLGNAWTYVSPPDAPTAPGQFSLREVERLNRSHPEMLLGVIGRPLAHSLSPPLHNWLLQVHRVPGWYLPFELDEPDGWMEYLRRTRLPFEGFSVTLPFKNSIIPFLDRTESPVDSVNTLRRQGASWVGSNTDLEGFLAPLRRRMTIRGCSAVVLGNGGVARTVVSALQSEGARVTVLGRNLEKVAALSRSYGCSGELLSQRPITADIIVNTTPVGQSPAIDQCLLEGSQLRCRLVYDLIYNPSQTELLRRAKLQGIETLSGVEMFVEQAALQFRLWAGVTPDRQEMRNWVEATLGPSRT